MVLKFKQKYEIEAKPTLFKDIFLKSYIAACESVSECMCMKSTTNKDFLPIGYYKNTFFIKF